MPPQQSPACVPVRLRTMSSPTSGKEYGSEDITSQFMRLNITEHRTSGNDSSEECDGQRKVVDRKTPEDATLDVGKPAIKVDAGVDDDTSTKEGTPSDDVEDDGVTNEDKTVHDDCEGPDTVNENDKLDNDDTDVEESGSSTDDEEDDVATIIGTVKNISIKSPPADTDTLDKDAITLQSNIERSSDTDDDSDSDSNHADDSSECDESFSSSDEDDLEDIIKRKNLISRGRRSNKTDGLEEDINKRKNVISSGRVSNRTRVFSIDKQAGGYVTTFNRTTQQVKTSEALSSHSLWNDYQNLLQVYTDPRSVGSSTYSELLTDEDSVPHSLGNQQTVELNNDLDFDSLVLFEANKILGNLCGDEVQVLSGDGVQKFFDGLNNNEDKNVGHIQDTDEGFVQSSRENVVGHNWSPNNIGNKSPESTVGHNWSPNNIGSKSPESTVGRNWSLENADGDSDTGVSSPGSMMSSSGFSSKPHSPMSVYTPAPSPPCYRHTPILPKAKTTREILCDRFTKEEKEAAWLKINLAPVNKLMRDGDPDGDTNLTVMVRSWNKNRHQVATFYAMVERMKFIKNALSKKTNDGENALHLAALYAHSDPIIAKYIAEVMSECGEDINEVDDNNGNTVIHCLCWKGDSHMQVLQELLSINKFNVNIPNKYGVTPLRVACSKGAVNTVAILLASGAVLDQENMITNMEGEPLTLLTPQQLQEAMRLYEQLLMRRRLQL